MSDSKSLGILLFQGIGDDYFGYGLTNDLINDFDSINEIYVSDIQDIIKLTLSNLIIILLYFSDFNLTIFLKK